LAYSVINNHHVTFPLTSFPSPPKFRNSINPAVTTTTPDLFQFLFGGTKKVKNTKHIKRGNCFKFFYLFSLNLKNDLDTDHKCKINQKKKQLCGLMRWRCERREMVGELGWVKNRVVEEKMEGEMSREWTKKNNKTRWWKEWIHVTGWSPKIKVTAIISNLLRSTYGPFKLKSILGSP